MPWSRGYDIHVQEAISSNPSLRDQIDNFSHLLVVKMFGKTEFKLREAGVVQIKNIFLL